RGGNMSFVPVPSISSASVPVAPLPPNSSVADVAHALLRAVSALMPRLFVLTLSTLTAASLDTRLPDAAMRGDKDAVLSLLKQKVDINAAHGDGATALHWAAYNDDLETVKLLLAAGANVKATTREGAITPLFMACINGDAPM